MIAISGNSENTTSPASDNQPVQNTAISATLEAQKETHIYDNAEMKDVLNGARTNKIGEYSAIRASSDDCTEAALADWYYNFVEKNNNAAKIIKNIIGKVKQIFFFRLMDFINLDFSCL